MECNNFEMLHLENGEYRINNELDELFLKFKDKMFENQFKLKIINENDSLKF